MAKHVTQKKEKIQELIFGIHPILELLKAKKRKLFTIYTTKPVPKAWESISPLLSKETQIQYVTREVLNRLAGTTDHQSMVAWAGPLIIRKVFFKKEKHGFLLMLDSIQDPRNLGAILRSAYCAGIQGIILSSKNSAPLNAVALKSSAGLAEHLEIYQANSAHAAALELKNAGYIMYLATIDGTDATQVHYTQPLCLVIGNEAIGISKPVMQFGTQVSLPQRNRDISYNASVAAGILLFIIAHQQKII